MSANQTTVRAKPARRLSKFPVVAKLLRNPRFFAGGVFIMITIFAAVFAPLLSSLQAIEPEIIYRLSPPNATNWFGRDINGNDIFSTMLYGARLSLYISFLTVTLSLVLGVFVGLLSGYWQGNVDTTIMRVVEIFMAFPGILLAMSLVALLGPSLNTIIFSIAATGWTSYARLVRAQVLSLKEREYVNACRTMGASHSRILWRHILPGTISPLVVHSTFSLSGVIIVEAGLSFLGLGAQDDIPTWGGLLSQGSQIELAQAPHLTLIPGLAIFLLVISLNFMGDALRDELDPRSIKKL